MKYGATHSFLLHLNVIVDLFQKKKVKKRKNNNMNCYEMHTKYFLDKKRTKTTHN